MHNLLKCSQSTGVNTEELQTHTCTRASCSTQQTQAGWEVGGTSNSPKGKKATSLHPYSATTDISARIIRENAEKFN